MTARSIGNIVGAFITLGIVAVVFAKPQALDITFKGVQGLGRTFLSPVTGTR